MRPTPPELISIVTSDSTFGLAMRFMRDRDDAEDVVQEAAIRVIRYSHTYTPREGATPRAWVFAILRRVAIDALERRARDRAHVCESTGREPDPNTVSPESSLDRATVLSETMEDLGRINPVHAEVVRRRYLGEMSIREVAAELPIAEGTVMSATHRGIDALRELAA